MYHASGASWCSTPACPPRTARCCSSATGSSSSPTQTGPPHARAAPRTHPRTVLAAPGPGLAVLRPRELHHPPHRGARRRTTGVSGRHQLRRRGKTHRHLRSRGVRYAAPPTPAATCSPRQWPAAQRCSTPHASTTPPPPNPTPPPSTKSSAPEDDRSDAVIPCRTTAIPRYDLAMSDPVTAQHPSICWMLNSYAVRP